MQVKRFRAPSMKEALALVKEEFGEDAVILKSESIPRKGLMDYLNKDTIEVVAAIDPDEPAPKVVDKPFSAKGKLGYFAKDSFSHLLHEESDKPAASIPESPVVPEKPAPKEKTGPSVKIPAQEEKVSNEQMDSLRDEVRELRGLVKSMSRQVYNAGASYTLKDFADLPAPYAKEMMNLMEYGIDKNVAGSIIEEVSHRVPVDQAHEENKLRNIVIEEMAKLVRVTGPIKFRKQAPTIVILVGPSGSGKTTTLAKMAANSKFGMQKKVAIISTDSQSMSSSDALNKFASIARMPMSAVYSPDELKAALDAQQNKDLIFIDTAGKSPKDEAHMEELNRYVEIAGPAEVHLTLPANMKHLDLLNLSCRYRQLPLNAVIITKADETNTLGSILHLSGEMDLPLSYITFGQTIPDDIELANSNGLVNRILKVESNGNNE